MLTQLVAFSATQLEAVRLAIDERAENLIDGIRESIASAFTTTDEMQRQIDIDRNLFLPTVAALQQVDPVKADDRLTEFGIVLGEYRELLAKRRRDEAEVDAWNARAEAERKAAAAATATASA